MGAHLPPDMGMGKQKKLISKENRITKQAKKKKQNSVSLIDAEVSKTTDSSSILGIYWKVEQDESLVHF